MYGLLNYKYFARLHGQFKSFGSPDASGHFDFDEISTEFTPRLCLPMYEHMYSIKYNKLNVFENQFSKSDLATVAHRGIMIAMCLKRHFESFTRSLTLANPATSKCSTKISRNPNFDNLHATRNSLYNIVTNGSTD